MGNLIISGASDDLIEIDGLIADEFNVYGPATVTIKVDDAVHLIATAEYDDDGQWSIEVAGNFPAATVSWTKAPGEDYPDQRIGGYRIPAYSDVLIVHMGDIEARRIDVTCEED
ncbi:hypothetical protein [Pimelobacter simplex]|uniref:hypothetical protein n=1 Tax=Nocardioides simplex TaxID=2045 RepID=UPI003AAB81C7